MCRRCRLRGKKKTVAANDDERTNPRIAPMMNPNTTPVVATWPTPCKLMSTLEAIPKMPDRKSAPDAAPQIPPTKVPKNIESAAIVSEFPSPTFEKKSFYLPQFVLPSLLATQSNSNVACCGARVQRGCSTTIKALTMHRVRSPSSASMPTYVPV